MIINEPAGGGIKQVKLYLPDSAFNYINGEIARQNNVDYNIGRLYSDGHTSRETALSIPIDAILSVSSIQVTNMDVSVSGDTLYLEFHGTQ